MLRVETAAGHHSVLVVCSGRLVEGDGAEALRRAVMSQSAHEVLVDLSRVRAIDARGLGVLVELKTWAQRCGRRLQVVDPSTRVTELLQRTRLNSVLDISRKTRERGHAA